jgi:archaemetzincin
VLAAFQAADDWLLAELVPALQDTFKAAIETIAVIPLPADAYNSSRRQYRSTMLLESLARRKQPEWERLLGVADVDLYTPDLNFVFGEADARRGVAVFSSARLRAADRDTFVHRAATEAIHELGHTYGLGHCSNARCVMWFSNTLQETDRKGTRFCDAHAKALRQAIAESRSSSTS